jgi:HAE1 family hydrophobic/amphiphilic exporter-1
VLETMRRVRAVTADIDKALAARGLSLTLVYDETTYIDSAIGLVNDNILVGGLLTLGTLLLFLRNLRSTLIVALSIPVSVMGTFLALAAFGRTLNVISLAGIAFAVGMLIDNSVVVLENIFVRWQAGEDPRTAAVRGTTEVWGAILASTLTNVAVFLPVLFVRGEAGQLFGDIALAISAAVGLSLAVSGLVVPTAAAVLLRGRGAKEAAAVVAAGDGGGRGDLLRRLGGGFVAGVIGINRSLMAGTVRPVLASIVIFALAVLATWILLPKVEYLPEGNRNLVFGIMLPPPARSSATGCCPTGTSIRAPRRPPRSTARCWRMRSSCSPAAAASSSGHGRSTRSTRPGSCRCCAARRRACPARSRS